MKRAGLDAVPMPFGKYKGERIDDLPDSYLEWLWENIELHGDVERAVKETMIRRGLL